MVSPSIALLSFNTFLIIGTLILGIQTMIFQKRTSLRESLEQLDSLHVQHRRDYIGVILHEFNYIPFYRQSAVLKFYARAPTPEEKANVGQILNAEKIFNEVFDMPPEKFLDYELVTDASADESGVYIKTNTVDSVKCRTLAEKIQIDLELAFIDNDELPH